MDISQFELGSELGLGKFSKVVIGIKKDTREKYAIKITKKSNLSEKELNSIKRETKILQQINHPNVVKCYGSFETETEFFLVLELCEGGELFNSIIEREKYTEVDAQQVLISLAKALSYCHERNIVHRDLKPENILLSTKSSSNSIIKIADFGFATEYSLDMKTQLGTANYVAPEILKREGYDSKVDMWSFGVIAYILLCGYPPFAADTDAEIFNLIKSATYKFDPESWDLISPSAKDLIRRLICLDPMKRLTANEVLKHEWMITPPPTDVNMTKALVELRRLMARRKLKSGIGAVFALNKLKNLTAATKAAVTSTPSPSPRKQVYYKKPKSIHPIDVDLVKSSLLPLVVSVAVCVCIYQIIDPPGEKVVVVEHVLIGTGILVYLVCLLTSKCYKYGLHHLGEILKVNNFALLLCGCGISMNHRIMAESGVCLIAGSTVVWYLDSIGYILTKGKKFPIGVANRQQQEQYSLLFNSHHFWLVPFCFYWLNGVMFFQSYLLSIVLSIVTIVSARFLTPYSVRYGAYNKDVHIWNINLSYEFQPDLSYFGCFNRLDNSPPYMYLPYIILVYNLLNFLPVALLFGISQNIPKIISMLERIN